MTENQRLNFLAPGLQVSKWMGESEKLAPFLRVSDAGRTVGFGTHPFFVGTSMSVNFWRNSAILSKTVFFQSFFFNGVEFLSFVYCTYTTVEPFRLYGWATGHMSQLPTEVRSLFEMAREAKPAIIFVDEAPLDVIVFFW